ncbi:MAG: pitrilysin family protein [Bryobacteraceae bacterium]
MTRLSALVLLAAGCVTAQVFLPQQTVAQPKKSAAAPPPKATAPLPSWKDLVYPPLHAVAIPHVETVTLPNGMKLYLLEDHELPLVHGAARIRTGNLFDPPEKIGLATLTGAVLRTGGTRAKTGEQIDEELGDIAASVESDIDETLGSVSFSCLKENLDQVLAAFHDVLTQPEFRQDKLDLARTGMKGGIARRNDEPQDIAEREFANIVYGKNTPYGWQEEYDTINRVTRADLVDFYRRYFFPANTMLAVWGDFSAPEMRARLEKLFADWKAEQPPVPAFPPVAAKPAAGTYLAAQPGVTQTFFSMGQLGGVLQDSDYAALEIMADILGGGFQSRLFRRVRTEMGNAYEIEADWGANYDHPGLFVISGSTKSVSTVETLQAILEEVERIRSTEVSEEELKTAKDTALNSLVFAFDTKAKTLGRILKYEYFGYPRDFIQQYQRAIEAVTRADVLRAAKQHLAPANFTIVAVGSPEQFGQPLGKLGRPVIAIDLTIAEPKQEAAKADPASLAKGREIMARVQRAVGGLGKLAAVKDFTVSQDDRFDPSAARHDGSETDRWIAPSHLRQDSQQTTGPIYSYSDGKIGWMSTPRGTGPLSGAILKQVRSEVFHVYFSLLQAGGEGGPSVVAVDDRTVEISNGEQIVRLVIDPATGLPQQLLYDSPQPNGPALSMEEEYSDFREVNGIQVPFHVTYHRGGKYLAESAVREYRINVGLHLEDLERRP